MNSHSHFVEEMAALKLCIYQTFYIDYLCSCMYYSGKAESCKILLSNLEIMQTRQNY